MFVPISQSARDHFNRWGLCLILAGLFGSPELKSQVSSDGFNPNLDGTVQAVLIQSDGSIILGGAFTSVRPGGGAAVGRHNLVRYRPDGSLDPSFDPNLNGAVNALALQPDGRILVGGRFTTADPNRSGSPVARNGLLRLNVNGTLDAGFNPNLVGDRNPEVFALAVQADGKVAFGGRFNQIQPGGAGEFVTRNYLARVNADGSLDAGFDPSPNNIVYSLAAEAGGRLIVGGGFTQMQPGGASAATAVSRIARLDASGAIDSSFTIKADNRVLAMTFEADGSLLIGGDFHSLLQSGSETAIDRLFVARIRKDGSIDGDFRPNANASVNGIAIQIDGRILLAGGFTGFLPPGAVSPISQRYLARINPGGSLDSTFNSGPNFRVSAVAVGQDGSIVVGGAFTRFRPASSAGAINRNRAARIYSDGSLDAASTLDAGGSYSVLARLPDNGVLAAGNFSSAGGLTRLNLVKINASGVVSNTFAASTNGVVRDVVVQNDGKIVVVGEFSQVNDVGRQGAARLNADGSLDTAFHPSPNSPVYAVALASDGKIYLGGAFTSLNPNLGEVPVPRTYLARLNTDGTVDPDFSPGLGGQVESLALQSDGAILVGGTFTFVLPQGQQGSLAGFNLVRFKSDGAFDDTFRPGPNNTVSIITIQADGQILIGGQFTGLVPAASESVIPRSHVARVKTDGTLDEGFDPNPNAVVNAIAETGTGKILLGGLFTWLNPNGAELPVYRDRFVRLNADGTVDASLSVAADDAVQSFLQESNGDVLIGGSFSGLVAFTGQAGTTTGRLGRLKSDGNMDFTFTIRADNSAGSEVVAIAPQNDGTILVGGTFANLGGGANQNAARLFSDGSIDRSFASQVNGPIHALLSRPNRESDIVKRRLFALLNANGTVVDQNNLPDGSDLFGQVLALVEQADGKLIAGGSFTDGNGQIGPYLVRFNLDGSVDSGFKPITNGPVLALALQSDGKLLVGGSFTLINGTARNRIARIEANGDLDATFDPNAGNQINAIALQSDGKILIGGSFATLQPNGSATSINRSRLARLNTDGTVDTAFDPAPNDRVLSLAVQSDGQILMGGDFSSLAPGGGTAVARLRLARVTAAGAIDEAFNPQVGGPAFSIAIQNDGKFVIGGSFVAIIPSGATETVTRNAIARFNADGTLDESYDPNANASVSVVRLQADGKILVGGVFTSFRPNQSDFAIRRNRIARLNTDGTPDSAFNPNADSNVTTIKVRQDGTIAIGGLFSTLQQGAGILLGGAFSAVNGVAVSNLARVNIDGTPDTLFSPNPDQPVDGFVLQPDGRIVVIGEFTSIAGQTRNRIARFDSVGVLESGYNPDANGAVSAASLQADGKIVLGGAFTTIGGSARARLARLTATGTLDTGFQADANETVNALAVQSNGGIIVAGDFTQIGGIARPYLARVLSDGTVDASFNPAPDAPVHSIALQADGSMLIGGAFTAIAGSPRAGLARLTASGVLDAAFRADTDSAVRSVVLLGNGRPFLGGGFTRVGGQARFLTARLGATSSVNDRLAVDGSRTSISWTRDGALPEIAGAFFATSSDGAEWVSVGAGNRISGQKTWTVNLTAALPAAASYFIRAEGIVQTNGGSSSGIVRSVAQFYGNVPAGPVNLGESQDTSDAADQSGGSDGSGGTGGSSDGSGARGGAGSDGSGSIGVGAIFDWSQIAQDSSPDVTFTNLSSRVRLAPARSFITGFSIDGPLSKPVLIRAVGPGLAGFGISDPLPSPRLEVLDHRGSPVAGNNGWGGNPAIAADAVTVGAFDLLPDNADAALRLDLPPGTYTVRVSDSNGLPGVVLAEIYDLDLVSATTTSQLVNVSSRGPVASGSGVATGGFSVAGDGPAHLLIRAVGPGLTAFGVTGALADPILRVFTGDGRMVARNDDWNTPYTVDALYPAYRSADLVEATVRTGAFSLEVGSRDSVVLIEAAPGTYTAQATSADGTTGEIIIEVYLLK